MNTDASMTRRENTDHPFFFTDSVNLSYVMLWRLEVVEHLIKTLHGVICHPCVCHYFQISVYL